jgi:hypothetical protein
MYRVKPGYTKAVAILVRRLVKSGLLIPVERDYEAVGKAVANHLIMTSVMDELTAKEFREACEAIGRSAVNAAYGRDTG